MAESGVEIIFVSSDRSPEDMVDYMKESHGDWLAIEHGSAVAQGLKQKFNVSGIPCLVILKADGKYWIQTIYWSDTDNFSKYYIHIL